MTKPRFVWRVLADPASPAFGAGDEGFHERFHLRAREAFLEARALEAEGRDGVEVSKCSLREACTVMDLLNRASCFAASRVVEPATWRVAVKATRPIGAAAKRVGLLSGCCCQTPRTCPVHERAEDE